MLNLFRCKHKNKKKIDMTIIDYASCAAQLICNKMVWWWQPKEWKGQCVSHENSVMISWYEHEKCQKKS